VLFPQLYGKCQGKTRKDGARTALNVLWLLFVLFYVVFVCKCVLPPRDNPIAVNKYIISTLDSGSGYFDGTVSVSPTVETQIRITCILTIIESV
jgi:hypothetical protein